MTTTSLLEEVITITEQYLGPAARRFVIRQVAFHLKKDPENLEPSDIPELIEWSQATMALLTDDKSMVDNYGEKLGQLVWQSKHQ
jgi:hypothetical protein